MLNMPKNDLVAFGLELVHEIECYLLFLTNAVLKVRHQLILKPDILVSIRIEKSLKHNHKSNKSEEITKSIADSIHHPTKTTWVGNMTLEVRMRSFPEDTSIKTVYVVSKL